MKSQIEMGLEWKWVWKIMVVMIIVLCGHFVCSRGCREEERSALLRLKASINYPNGSSLPSWEQSNRESNCCKWEGVTCGSEGEVFGISLNSIKREQQLGDCSWYLNASLFLPLHQLHYLSLQFNCMVSWVEDKACASLSSKLKHLEVVDLSFNKLDNSLLPFLRGLPSSIKKLDLSGNFLQGFIPLDYLEALQNLEELDLAINTISGFTTIHSSEREYANLKNLKYLDLTDNNMNSLKQLQLSEFPALEHLILAGNQLNGSIDGRDIETLLNLEELDLSLNEIENFITTSSEGPSRLKNLSILDLSNNTLGNIKVLSYLGTFASLRQLYLSGNNMTGSVHLSDIEAWKSLEELDLSSNNVNGFLTDNRSRNLPSVKRLYADNCVFLDPNLLQGLGMMTSIRVLTLYGAKLNDKLTAHGWLCELKSLQVLDLSANSFSGILPPCFRNMTSLRILDVWRNQLTGNIAISPLIYLTSLEYLSLSYNDFQVPHSFKSFTNHSNLKVVLSDNNKIILDSEFQNIIPRFQLQILSLSNCMLNGSLPSFLYHQHDLRVVDLSSNYLQGSFPTWFFDNNTRLQGLFLGENLLTGPFQHPLHRHANVSTIDISHNQMEGNIEITICAMFPNLKRLDMSNNAFEGKIPSCFDDMKALTTLSLSSNYLSGELPNHFLAASSVQVLDLSNNNLRGQIFWISSPTQLQTLLLQGNNFSSKIPVQLSSANLETLDLSNNNFSGELPRWINVTSFREINMSRNHLEGRIPEEYCEFDNLDFMDLSGNCLSGFLPSCFPPSIRYVHLSRNRLSGPLPYTLQNNQNLLVLDLSHNNLTGSLPNWIGNLDTLTVLLLRSNLFESGVPTGLCNIKQLSILDLSRNNLIGPIPPCLKNISFQPSEAKAYDDTFLTISDQPLYSKSKGSIPYLDDTNYSMVYTGLRVSIHEKVEFTTKSMAYSYEGQDLIYMSGIDLSCNKLSGEIPPEMGSLSEIHALNLSHNNLSGSIPVTFSNLRQLESLDLSYNHLNGNIPSQLTELNSLAVFSVAHNNLSGRTPGYKGQFITFGESSYEGNPYLCGPPLPNNCIEAISPSSTPDIKQDSEEDDDNWIDMSIFYISFGFSYITMFLVAMAILQINPSWRRRWFHLIERTAISGRYFVVDHFQKLRNIWHGF